MDLLFHPTPLDSVVFQVHLSLQLLLQGCLEGSRAVSAPEIEDSSLGAVHGAEFTGGPPGGEGRRCVGGGLGVAVADGET